MLEIGKTVLLAVQLAAEAQQRPAPPPRARSRLELLDAQEPIGLGSVAILVLVGTPTA